MLIERLVNSLSSFFTMVVAANLLSGANFGLYAYNTTIYGILAPVIFFGLNSLLVRTLLDTNNTSSVLINVTAIRFGAFVFVAFVLSAMSLGNDKISILLIVALFGCILQTFESYNQAFNRNHITTLVRICIAIIFVALKIYLLWFAEPTVNQMLLVFVCEILIYYVTGFLISLRIKIDVSLLSLTEMKYMTSGGIFLLASGFAEIINLRIDQVMIAEMIGIEQSGQYAIGVRFIEFPVMFAAVVAAAYFPKLYSRSKNSIEFFRDIRRINLTMFVMATLFILALYIFGPTVIDVFFGEKYDHAKLIMFYLLPCLYILFFQITISKWIVASGIYWYSLFSHTLGAVTNVGLNLMLIPIWGLAGAVVASYISYFVACWGALLFSRKTRVYFRHAYTP